MGRLTEMKALSEDEIRQILAILEIAERLDLKGRATAARAAERKRMTHTDRALSVLRHPKVKPTDGLLSALLAASDAELTNWLEQVEESDESVLQVRGYAAADLSASDIEIRMALDKALRASEPGYLGIDAVYPDEETVVYAVAPEDAVKMLRRKYKWAKDVVTLAEERDEVRPITRYEVVKAASAPCDCQEKENASMPDKKPDEKTPEQKAAEASNAAEKAARIQAIIADTSTLFTAEDAPYLEGLSEERLSAFETQVRAAKQASDDAVLRARIEGNKPRQLTTEEFLAAAPAEIKTIVSEHRAAHDSRKADLIKVLRVAQTAWSEAELQEMELHQLERLSKACRVADVFETVDYGGMGAPRSAAAQGGDTYQNPPDGYAIALEKRRGA